MRYEIYKETLTKKDGSNAILIANNVSYDEAQKIKGVNPNIIIITQHVNGA